MRAVARRIRRMTDHTAIFLDTAYIFALVNTRDQWHARARQWQAVLTAERRPLLTSAFVLMEIGDGLAAVGFRRQAVQVLDTLAASSLVEVVPATSELYAAGLELYRNRHDKDWGLTDCTSFELMRQRGLREALTTDEHFQQAGFRVLLREQPQPAS
jgi:uncharacterized protein